MTRSFSELRSATVRARDRVIQYLLAEFANPELADGARLPPMRKLAAHLHVSLPTIHSAMRKLSQEGRIKTRGGCGTFLVARSERKAGVLRLAVSIPLTRSTAGGVWAYQVGAGIFHAASRGKQPIFLVPLAQEIEGTDAARDRLLALRSEVDGLILFAYSLSPKAVQDEVCAAYEKDGKPVVHVGEPTDGSTENFVSFDFFNISRQVAGAWRETGRRRVAFLVERPLQDSLAARICVAGLVSGLGTDIGDTIALRIMESRLPAQVQWDAAVRKIFARGTKLPDAIYCANDRLALGVMAVIRERGLRVPDDVSVVAGVGLDLSTTAYPRLTHLEHPLEQMGEALVSMLARRIELKGLSVPGRLLPMTFGGGATTRPTENVLLNIKQNGFGHSRESGNPVSAAVLVSDSRMPPARTGGRFRGNDSKRGMA